MDRRNWMGRALGLLGLPLAGEVAPAAPEGPVEITIRQLPGVREDGRIICRFRVDGLDVLEARLDAIREAAAHAVAVAPAMMLPPPGPGGDA